MKNLLNIAADILEKSKNPVQFYELWNKIVAENKISKSNRENLISNFYLELLLNKKFFQTSKNVWDLREKYTQDEIYNIIHNESQTK